MLPVGQEDHRVELLHDLSATIDGNGRVVIIGGEAGIGKTTLVRSLAAEAARRNVRVLEANCFELYSTPAFGPWLNLFGILERDPSLPAPPVPFASDSLHRVTDQAALFASVRDFFVDLTRLNPVLLVLEDLHWSDPASLDLLHHGRFLIPADAGMATDAGAIEGIAVADDRHGLEHLDEVQQPLKRGGSDAGPEVGIAEDQHCPILNGQREPGPVRPRVDVLVMRSPVEHREFYPVLRFNGAAAVLDDADVLADVIRHGLG